MPVAFAGRSRRTMRPQPRRSWWSEGQGPRGMRAGKARSGLRTGQACPGRWSAYGKPARHNKKERFTALLHHVNPETLRLAFNALKKDAAPGVDGTTWSDYEVDLE